jgi:septal ring factor EnvC (AmiA/AmiB activator)
MGDINQKLGTLKTAEELAAKYAKTKDVSAKLEGQEAEESDLAEERDEDEEQIKEEINRMKHEEEHLNGELGSIRNMIGQLRENNAVKEAQLRSVADGEDENDASDEGSSSAAAASEAAPSEM